MRIGVATTRLSLESKYAAPLERFSVTTSAPARPLQNSNAGPWTIVNSAVVGAAIVPSIRMFGVIL